MAVLRKLGCFEVAQAIFPALLLAKEVSRAPAVQGQSEVALAGQLVIQLWQLIGQFLLASMPIFDRLVWLTEDH